MSKKAEISPEDALARRIADHMWASEGTSRVWGLNIEEARAGAAVVSMVLRDDMLNGHGTAHGGMIFALADNAFAYACNSRNVRSFAQHASISFLSPGKGGEKLTAHAREDAQAGRTGVYTVTVLGEDGRTVAVFQGLSRTAGGAVLEEEVKGFP